MNRKAYGMCVWIAASTVCVNAAEIHVAKTGQDSNPGTAKDSLLTISRAVELAQPGDTVWVHAGTYREEVQPVRGGMEEDQRICFRVVPGEEVFIKGSEQITSWTPVAGGVWKVELPNRFFGDYNPYALKMDGQGVVIGKWHHRGDVYLNGQAFYEQEAAERVSEATNSWFGQVTNGTTTIWAHFGAIDPNAALTEINVRETLFFPKISGLKYITVDGFNFTHAALNWIGKDDACQLGAVGPRMGKYWIIENCTVAYARSVGISIGMGENIDITDINTFGSHLVRNNIIRRCGQCGINGKRGGSRSLLVGNLIEEINYRSEFGGAETAAIKVHGTCDLVILNNLIRSVHETGERGGFGVWIDFANQGIRISRNVFYGVDKAAIFLEMNHGPMLVDNNIFFNKHAIGNTSEATVIAHNLFANSHISVTQETKRQAKFFKPHTTLQGEPMSVLLRDEKFFNNLFIQQGFQNVPAHPGNEADYNAYLEGALSNSFGDKHSVSDPMKADFKLEERELGVAITFEVNAATVALNGPQVGAKLVGIFRTTGQSLEDPFGTPIEIETDFNGKKFAPPVPGPLADLKAGLNTIRWDYKKQLKGIK